MDATARDFFQTTPADTQGLEDLFDAEIAEVLPGSPKDYQEAPTEGIPVAEAARLLVRPYRDKWKVW